METKTKGWTSRPRREKGEHFREPSSASSSFWISISSRLFYEDRAGWRAGLFQEFFKEFNTPPSPQSSHPHPPGSHTHTHTRSPLHPWHVGPAVERVIVTPCPMLGRTHGPNCPCHRPDSGCEILDLTSSALMKEHGGTGTGGGAEDTPRWGVRGCGGGGGGVGSCMHVVSVEVIKFPR